MSSGAAIRLRVPLVLACCGLLLVPIGIRAEDISPDRCSPYPRYQIVRENTFAANGPGGIPVQVSRPPQLAPKVDIRPFGCQREFTFRSKTQLIDSFHRQDGDKLRTVIAEVPEALEYLNTYQKNRRRVRVAAYTGTVGILIAVGSLLVSQRLTGGVQNTVRGAGLIGGFGITGLSLAYGYFTLEANEANLDRAVQVYNAAKPDTPITLKFTTGLLPF